MDRAYTTRRSPARWMTASHIPHGWQLVYIVVSAAVAASSSRAAHLASFSSGCAVMSLSVRVVLCSSADTVPFGLASSDPNGPYP